MCAPPHRAAAPVNEAVAGRASVTTRFNGSLWYDSPFKGPPTAQVEEAWHSAMQYGMLAVSADDYRRVGHSLRTAVQFPAEAGGGFMATTVGTHQLHCLHYVWKDHHRPFFPEMERKAREVPELYERHYEHCVDYIRQSLMCQFDTGIIPYNWVLDHQNPTPNGITHHKCVDWDALQDWLSVRAVEVPDNFTWTQPADAVTLEYNP